MNMPSEHVPADESVEFEDTIMGALYDDTGLAFTVFLRVSNSGGAYSCSEVMAQSPYSGVFVIEHAGTEGMFKKRFVITLTNLSRTVQFTPKNIFEIEEDGMIRSFAAATSQHISQSRRSGGKDVLSDFWRPIDRAKMGAFRLLAKGPASTKVRPSSTPKAQN